jgi:hypothetical protein
VTFCQRKMNTKYIMILLVACLGALSPCQAQVTNRASPWFPALTQPLTTDALEGELATINRLTGNLKAPVTIWVDRMDVNGDKREDAIVTIAAGEGAGARSYLRTHTTYVLLGSGQSNAVFEWTGATLWFSMETYYGMNQTKFPDVTIRRQFSIMIENGEWTAKICETRYSNQAGDSGTRGMLFDSVANSSVPVTQMKDWKPKMRE